MQHSGEGQGQEPNFYHGSQVFPINFIKGLSTDFCLLLPENRWLFTAMDLQINSNLDGRNSAEDKKVKY